MPSENIFHSPNIRKSSVAVKHLGVGSESPKDVAQIHTAMGIGSETAGGRSSETPGSMGPDTQGDMSSEHLKNKNMLKEQSSSGTRGPLRQ